jgi:asparagine synthase (glutamine-hydrolysing)
MRYAESATGVMLSGGLDSATVAALAAADASRPRLRTYSATFPGVPSADETPLIAELAERCALQSGRLAVRDGSAVAGSVEFLEHAQLPPSSPNLFFWRPLLDQAAADGVRVLLDGEGGDELFGAPRYLPADRLRRGRVVAAYRLINRLPGAESASRRQVLRAAAEFALRGAMPKPMRRFAARSGWEQPRTPSWLSASIASLHRATVDPDTWMQRGGPRWRAWLLHAIRDSTGGPQLARDHVRQRAAMAGLEAAHPLLDVDVVEFMLTVDPELSFEPHLDRPLLREAMAGGLPDSIRMRRDKSSFDAPFQRSLVRELAPISALLLEGSPRLAQYVDLGVLKREVLERPGRKFAFGGQAWALTVWRLVTAELWLNLQEEGRAPRALLERCGFPSVTLDLIDTPTASSSLVA